MIGLGVLVAPHCTSIQGNFYFRIFSFSHLGVATCISLKSFTILRRVLIIISSKNYIIRRSSVDVSLFYSVVSALLDLKSYNRTWIDYNWN